MSTDKPLIISSIEESQEALQKRFHEYGYLHFKGYVSPEKCEALKNSFLENLAPYIIETDDHPYPVLNGEPFFETDPIWDEVYPGMQSQQSFHEFFHEPEIESLMKLVSGTDVFVYPMKMARIGAPKKLGYETPPHQDAHSHQAGPTMAGIWVALHDVAEDMGRLKMLPYSHKRGVRPVHEALGVGGIQCEIYPYEDVWHVSNVEQGDVIIFHSCTVHKAEPNTSEKSVRLSVDTRFCDYGAPVFSTNLEPHHGWRIDDLSWESIYEGWGKTDYQYYWKDYPNFF